jgi:hypothetical protein
MPHVMSVNKFEQFFRSAGGIDVDKSDIARYDAFINNEVEGLLIRAQASAKMNLRDVIEPQDLPITKGLQENIERFRRFDKELELEPVLDHITIRPRLDMAYSDDTEARLAEIAGGLSVALAHVFKIIDPKIEHPFGEEWERATKVFNELA